MAPMEINESEFRQRLYTVMAGIVNGKPDKKQKIELFNLYNDRFFPSKRDMYCNSCVNKVFKTLDELYFQYKENDNEFGKYFN